MSDISKLDVFGDSVLKGIQINPVNKRYCVNNNIDYDLIGRRYSLQIKNFSSFGCTVIKGQNVLNKNLSKGLACNAIVMDYGGNDCDFNWAEIAAAPDAVHNPHTPIEQFKSTYIDIINTLKSKGIVPILTTLPPIESSRFFNWFCGNLNKEAVLSWLGNINTIYKHQEHYSNIVEEIASETKVKLIDLRDAFLATGHYEDYLCEDGIHPNTDGQRLITNTMLEFGALQF